MSGQATWAGAASSTADDSRCQASPQSLPSTSALCSANTYFPQILSLNCYARHALLVPRAAGPEGTAHKHVYRMIPRLYTLLLIRFYGIG